MTRSWHIQQFLRTVILQFRPCKQGGPSQIQKYSVDLQLSRGFGPKRGPAVQCPCVGKPKNYIPYEARAPYVNTKPTPVTSEIAWAMITKNFVAG